MTLTYRYPSLAVIAAALFVNGALVGCNEKQANTATPSGKTGTDTSTDESDGSGDSGTDSGSGDDAGSGSAAFDLCAAMEDKKDTIEGFASYIDELCGTGANQNKLPTLRKPENVFKGGEPKLLKKTDNGDGTVVSVRLFTSTVVKAKASDYFALIRLQVTKPKAFSDAYEHDDLIKLSEVVPAETSSSFRYQYTEGEGLVDYNATARFYTLKKSTAYVSATKLDKSQETMKDLKGLIIVSQKDDENTEVFTMSDQTYEVADGQTPELYDQKATEKAGKEQQHMYKNAETADKAPGLLK